jgi:hypothetical protein
MSSCEKHIFVVCFLFAMAMVWGADPYPLLNEGDLTAKMPQRDQWDKYNGYCGETSFIQGAMV